MHNRAVGVGHYENFPVASVLCPPRLRPAVVAIYRFARVADDLADEGTAPPEERLRLLRRYRDALDRACASPPLPPKLEQEPGFDAWPQIFDPLARSIHDFGLPPPLLHALLDAFEQDVRNPTYPDRDALLAYCRRSANPVGRLLLHLYGLAGDASLLARSDDVCSALQLINFWQDLGTDGPRGRHYVPEADRLRHGVSIDELRERRDSHRTRALVRELCDWAESMMRAGSPLALQVPGRAGWELRLVVQGGLRILEKIRHIDHASLARRVRLGPLDLPLLVWRAWGMPAMHAVAAEGASR